MTLVLALLVSYRWWQSLYEQTNWGVDYLRPAQIAMAGTTFLWLNVILLRTLHHWADIRYQLDELLESWLVQTSLSIFWTLTGMAIMVVAARGGLRKLWLIGSGLLGVVVVKLFVVDQSASDTVERIVSFIIVGLLLMAIGYFAPIPPKVIGAAFNRGSGDEKGCDEPNPPAGI